jgi:hypothetical protein
MRRLMLIATTPGSYEMMNHPMLSSLSLLLNLPEKPAT